MKKTKKKLVASLVAIMLLLVSVIGVTLAWFVDETGSIKNTFTVGNVDIALYEASEAQGDAPATEDDATALTTAYKNVYLPANGIKLLPTSVVNKYTYIVNYGDVNAYVGMTVSVPTKLVDDLTIPFNTTDWALSKTVVDADENGNTTYSYVYKTALQPGKQTNALLSTITVNQNAGAQFVADLAALSETNTISNDFSVVVTGYAIQELGAGASADIALNTGFDNQFDVIEVNP